MKKDTSLWAIIPFFISLFSYWLLLSCLDRCLFLFSIHDKLGGSDIDSFIATTLAGYKLDFSLAGYLLALPFLFFIVQIFFVKKPVSKWWLRGYVMVPTFLFAAFTAINIPLYHSWNEKISKRAIQMAASTPEGLMASIDVKLVGAVILMLVVYFFCAHFFYHGIVVRFAKYRKLSLVESIVVFFVGVVVVFSLIRGGYGRANLNPSVAYYSDNTLLNHAAVNTYWALLKDLTKSQESNPYQFMREQDAEQLVISIKLESPKDSLPKITNTDRPNIVLILLEGITAQVIEELGGESNVTPGMNKLMQEGVNFRRAYAVGDRSDKGMIGTLSGFPSQGPESIIKHISKHEKLPAITQLYDSLGYSTSFYHGGQSEFYNFKSYMLAHGVHRVIDDNNFDINTKRVSWGVYDDIVANRMFDDLNKEKNPFFSIFYTVVNHEPFDLEGNHKFGNESKANGYRSTVYYTDSVVYDLVQKAKSKPWYDNTVFVVVSDHGHLYPSEKYDLTMPERYHIPMFLFGGGLKEEYKGQVVNGVVSQSDLVTTLWNIVSKNKSPFEFSTDLFDPKRKSIAFINSNNTFGVVTNDFSISYDLQGQRTGYMYPRDMPADTANHLLSLSKAYYQTVYQRFLSY
ncbi:LTA synthase family protein [Sphingobacterium bovistauri]|uniref:Sulfatase-like hydrolase/transferase n=1 Tax=Sphingobacterium bovistauri TaxID=2781959 RepID=A0ABS7Z3R9_9SPHI|nr:alkaline phosphatase family protein [Sphingobacterium bovistauri]MCA5004653.1 sulfatase-like hydrolase/transferase [Sphingobacterium bovistauri]